MCLPSISQEKQHSGGAVITQDCQRYTFSFLFPSDNYDYIQFPNRNRNSDTATRDVSSKNKYVLHYNCTKKCLRNLF